VAAVHPLRRLLGFARPYRRDAVLGTVFSVLNKVFDVLPELLIGVAVDVVVNRKASFLATHLGIADPTRQLYLLVALTVGVWVCESLFEYLYALRWRGLAQDLQHELRTPPMRTCRRCRRTRSRASAAAACSRCSTRTSTRSSASSTPARTT